jgi:hypothetical protein
MNAQHDPDAVARYAAAVRAAVADLGDEERAQLLDDLEAHLQEVAAESGTPLTERLGPPEAYAAELRAAYGAPAPQAGRGPAAPPGVRRWRWRQWRLPVGILAAALVLAGVFVTWRVSHSGSGAQWSESHLRSEAAAGHVRQVVISGLTATATDTSGVQHSVDLPDASAPIAQDLVSDNVDVTYVQSSTPAFHVGFLVVMLLLYGVPFAVVMLLAVLGVGVLWRLFRRLGRPTGIM